MRFRHFQPLPYMAHRLKTLFVVLSCWLCAFPLLAQSTDTLCAVVKIRIEQTLSLERQAFDAALTVYNEQVTPLDDINITVEFKDANGNPVIATSDTNNTSAQFYIRVSDMVGVSGDNVSGSGSIAGNSEAEIHWLIIPSPGAAGGEVDGLLYYVGATMMYSQAGVSKVMAIGADSITVKPTPQLSLDYFITKDVYADNPLTTNVVEEAEPFKLGVLVKNSGIVPANNVSIRSAQPEIIENEQDLLIDFSIIGSQVNGQTANTGLLANFGTIAADGTASGYWLMETTLAGTFTDIAATVSHAENLGGQLTAIIKEDAITSHLLAGYVRNNQSGEDDINDFLADDGTTGSPLYRLYESNGKRSDVTDLSASATLTYDRQSGNYIYYQLNVPTHDGLLFVDVPDPTRSRYTLTRAVTGGNRALPTDNAWTQFVRENGGSSNVEFVSHLRLFDIQSDGQYELAFNVNRYQAQAPMILLDDFADGVTVTDGDTVRLTLRAIDVNGDAISFMIKNLPAGATWTQSVNANGEVIYIFEWQPNTAGRYELELQATDGSRTSTETLVIEVKDKVVPANWLFHDSFED